MSISTCKFQSGNQFSAHQTWGTDGVKSLRGEHYWATRAVPGRVLRVEVEGRDKATLYEGSKKRFAGASHDVIADHLAKGLTPGTYVIEVIGADKDKPLPAETVRSILNNATSVEQLKPLMIRILACDEDHDFRVLGRKFHRHVNDAITVKVARYVKIRDYEEFKKFLEEHPLGFLITKARQPGEFHSYYKILPTKLEKFQIVELIPCPKRVGEMETVVIQYLSPNSGVIKQKLKIPRTNKMREFAFSDPAYYSKAQAMVLHQGFKDNGRLALPKMRYFV